MTDSNAFYRAFEERLRGSRELILLRLQVYRPCLNTLLDLFDRPAALDIGCGRGEWLELLAGLGFDPEGIDLDDGMLAACRERGMAVETGDGVARLAGMADQSLALVSAFHVVEHLPFDRLQILVKEALRVLQPGGLLILETPNPENPVVGANSFYLDPTHNKPLPPGLLGFLPEFYGFHRTLIMRLQEEKGIRSDPCPTLTHVFFSASPDYAVVAQKTAEPEILVKMDPVFQQSWGIDLNTLTMRYDTALTGRFHDLEARFTREVAQIRQALDQVRRDHQEERAALAHELKILYGSRSWRMTRPLRQAAGLIQALFGSGLRSKTAAILCWPAFWLLKQVDRMTRHHPRVRNAFHGVLGKLRLSGLAGFYHTARSREAAAAFKEQSYELTEAQKAAQTAWMPRRDDLTTEELLNRIRQEITRTRQQGDPQ